MSSPNKVTRLWEGVGEGMLVEVARDEWKQERRVTLMWLRWPDTLTLCCPFLTLLWLGLPCLTKQSDPWGCPIYEKDRQAQSSPQGLHPGAHPSKAVPFLGSASCEHTGGPGIVLYFDETFRKDILRFGGRDSKAQPKDLAWHCAWVQCFRFRGGEFFSCALHWLCAAPLKPTAPTPHWELQKPQLGLLVLLLPSHAGWEHLLCHKGFAELPKWGKRQPKLKQGHRGRGTVPCSAFSSIT